jgi:glycogen operon protein
MRNLLATLLFSRGTPMILAGDEFARTQQGNNNAYAQDNDISWLDWDGIDQNGWDLFAFTKHLIEIRQRQPLFHRGRFLTGAFNEDFNVKDVSWLDPAGKEMTSEQWTDGNARCFGMLLDGRAQPTGIRRKGLDRTLLLMINAHHETLPFLLPSVPGGKQWRLLVDTSKSAVSYRQRLEASKTVELLGRSLALWELQPSEITPDRDEN